MNRKGFTLIELLAVIIILALITTITITTISSVLKESKNNTEEIFKRELTSMIEDYITLHMSEFKDSGKTLTLQDLINDGITTSKDLINPKTKTQCNLNATITVNRTSNGGYCFKNVNLTCTTIKSCN